MLCAIAARPAFCGGTRNEGDVMRSLSFKAALAAALILILAPLEAASGWGQVRVVAFGDSLLDAGTYAPFASKAPFNGGRFTTNPA
jgi:hypothetical protein